MSAEDLLGKSRREMIEVLTEGRRGKSALSAENVWNYMAEENARLNDHAALRTAFIEKFSNLRTT